MRSKRYEEKRCLLSIGKTSLKRPQVRYRHELREQTTNMHDELDEITAVGPSLSQTEISSVTVTATKDQVQASFRQ